MSDPLPTHESLRHLQEKLGYTFQSPACLKAALVHTSYVNEHPELELESNERMELLGDAVLGLVVAHRLYEQLPSASEGDLTVLRAWLVRQSTLTNWATERGLGDFLVLGRGEERGGGRERPAILARACEAIIAAVYLDGGVEAARSLIQPLVDDAISSGLTPEEAVDPKLRLQQLSHARFESTPSYTVVQASGADHAPTFEVEVRVGPEVVARGTGPSKRTAQQAAARTALVYLDAVQEPADEEGLSIQVKLP